MNLRGKQGKIYMKAKGDYPDRVLSDQMVVRKLSVEAELHEQWPKATKERAIRLESVQIRWFL
jgi:hypothetical protein